MTRLCFGARRLDILSDYTAAASSSVQTGIGFLQQPQMDDDAVTGDRVEELEAAAERADRRRAFADSFEKRETRSLELLAV